jgi:diguanylate cyclase (GGDEF)-like protein
VFRVFRWFASVALPLLVVYLLTEHPQLTGESFYTFSSREILLIHGGLLLLTGLLSLLFARSRAVLVGLLTLLFSISLPILANSDYDPQAASLAFLASGFCLIAAPEKKVLKITSLIWLGFATIFGLGLLTVGELYGRSSTNLFVLAAVVAWGVVTLVLRVRSGKSSGESLMMSCLVGTAFAGWTFGYGPDSLSETGFRVLCLLASLPSLASVVEHSFRLAYIDELTEIPGRRALVESMQDPDQVFTLAMLDVDHFKKFNDTHGHEVGDHVLRMVAARLATVGVGGTAYRYGGEEFTVVFPGKRSEEVVDELERLRELVEQSPLVLRSPDRPRKKPNNPSRSKRKKPSVSVTISIGAATRTKNEHWERVMKRADRALYKAKEEGRNRVCQAS